MGEWPKSVHLQSTYKAPMCHTQDRAGYFHML